MAIKLKLSTKHLRGASGGMDAAIYDLGGFMGLGGFRGLGFMGV